MLHRDHSSALSPSALSSSVLVLNRGYQPVHVITVRRAMVLLCRDCCEVIDNTDNQYANYSFAHWLEHSELRRMELEDGLGEDEDEWIRGVRYWILAPRIVRLTNFDRFPRIALRFNRRNLFARDQHRCQYCHRALHNHQLTMDHVVPRSRGGPTSWENVVCACVQCNTDKGDRTPSEASMNLARKPVAPQHHPLLLAKLRNPKYAAWKTFLPAMAREVEG